MSDLKFERMGHVAIHVSDIEKAARFYSEILGLKSGWKIEKDWTIFTCGKDDLALIRNGPGVHHPPHFGFRVSSAEAVDEAYEKLKRLCEAAKSLRKRLAGKQRD